jgi:hypothetical protein
MAVVACTIASGQSLSAAADLGAAQLSAIITPPAWDAADLTLQASADAGVNFFDLYLGGKFTELMIPCQAGRIYSVFYLNLPKSLQVKLRSGRVGIPVLQSASRAFSLITI